MVTKQANAAYQTRLGYVLAKIQMVTKQAFMTVDNASSYVLAKIQMVTKLQSKLDD